MTDAPGAQREEIQIKCEIPLTVMCQCWASQVALLVNLPPANGGGAGGAGLSPGSGRSLEEGAATHPSVLAWRIPRTEGPAGLQSTGSQSQTRLKRPHAPAHTHQHRFINYSKYVY